jgi:rhodanese-related sulfurtransferase
MEPSPRKKADLRVVALAVLGIVFVGGLSLWRTVLRHPGEALSETLSTDETKFPTLSAKAVEDKEKRGEALVFLDVRPPEDYQKSHIPHSLSLPGTALSGYAPEAGKMPIVVFSAATQTGMLPELLRSASFPYSLLEGGFEAWTQAGGETISVGDPNAFADQSKVNYIDPKEAQALLANPGNLFILDVQTEGHYQEKHLKGAVNIPLAELEKRAHEIPPARPLLVYGENELASFQGGVRLFDLHFYGAMTLSGNELIQKTVDLPVEKSE